MADESMMSWDTDYEIPSRVKTDNVLQLAESRIPGAGRGIVVQQDVREGALLFEIPGAIMSTVSRECLLTTCDFCFAHKSRRAQTDPRPNLTFTVCRSCRIVAFCSVACSDAAWATYHQFECVSLARIVEWEPELAGVEGCANPRSNEFRAIIRILSLQEGGVLSGRQWEEIMSLMPQPPLPDGQGRYLEEVEVMLDVISRHAITRLSMSDVERVIRAYFNNRCFIQLWTPIARATTNVHRHRSTDVPVGECLEPFFSMLNHSCDPNATWQSEGRTLQVRAERDISRGEEITICYGWADTFSARRYQLSAWIGRCACSICIDPPREPSGLLGSRVARILSASGPDAAPVMSRSIRLLCAIRDLEHAGFGCEAWPMRPLYTQLFRCRAGQYDGPQMLKTWLRIYFFIEPAMRPHECIANRLRSLSVLAYLLDLRDPSYAHLLAYPAEVEELAPSLHYQLRVRLLHDVRRCRSPASYYRTWEEAAFVRDMNELLAWAELPALTESEILSTHPRHML